MQLKHLVTGTTILATGLTSAGAAGEVVIDNFESYSSGVGTWQAQNNGVNASLGLLQTGAIEGNNSLQSTLGLGLLGAGYEIYNNGLDVPVPRGIQRLEFSYRVVLGLNVGKNFTVTLRDQNNNTYVSPSQSMALVTLNVTNNVSIPLSTFSPPIAAGTITRLKGLRLTYTNSVASVAALEQIDNFRFTWTPQANTPHNLSVDFGTRVSGPNSNFNMILTVDPADVDVGKFRIRVAYNSSQVTLTGITNNTGQPGSTVNYSLGAQVPIVGDPNVNVYQVITMDAAPALSIPSILGQLNFTATAGFSDPNNRVWVVLSEDVPGSTLLDENWDTIPVTFDTPGTPVPVGLSEFSVE